MRIFRRITIGMVLAGVAAPAMAGSVDRENLALCKNGLKNIYGEDSRLKLKSIKQHRKGKQMKIQAISTDGEKQMTTCWVDGEGATRIIDANGAPLETSTLAKAE
ncbi:MAG: hypothetical protein V7746_08080 [Halioglobus sp.]